MSGRPVRARRSRKPPVRALRTGRGAAWMLVIPGFALVYAAVAAVWMPPFWVAGLYVVLSGVTFIAYAADKSAAASGAWRTRERTLHVLALAGGWPGALLAQQRLRHKSAKRAFRRVFWASALFNVLGLVVLASPIGQAVLRVG